MVFIPEVADDEQEDLYGGRKRQLWEVDPKKMRDAAMDQSPSFPKIDRYDSGRVGYGVEPEYQSKPAFGSNDEHTLGGHDTVSQKDPGTLTNPVRTPQATTESSASNPGSTLGNTSLGVKTDTPELGRRDLSSEFDKIRKQQPTLDQFKQPPLKTWQKIALPIAGFAAELGTRMSGGKGGQGAQMVQEGLDYPETEQKRKFGEAEKQWQTKLGGIETEAKLGETEARTRKLEEPAADARTVETKDTEVGPLQWDPKAKTWQHMKDPNTGKDIPVKSPTPREAETPLTDEQLPNLNKDLRDRFQANNPGKEPPDNYVLKKGATKADYDRAMSALAGTESASATRTQREISNENIRLAREDKQKMEGLTWVTGTKNGRQIAVPLSQADSMGLENAAKMDANEQTKMQSARAFVPLATRALSLIDKKDPKTGKSFGESEMGVIFSRWDDFKAGKIGNEPKFAPLRVLNGLANTLLMNLHVGNRGGSYLMEHFQDLANAGKMNAETFKAALQEELQYAHDRAMMPDEGGAAIPKYDMDGNRISPK